MVTRRGRRGKDMNFWKGKRVFITGHTGFKGAWLALWLKKLGANVTGFSLAAEEQSLFTYADIDSEVNSIIGDIRDLSALTNALHDSGAEVVFHLAAQALVRPSYNDPVTTLSTNIMGTAHLFEAVRKCEKVQAVVNVTSDKCYENREEIWGYREHDPMGGYDPYSASKGCSELITSAYQRSFFFGHEDNVVALASARAGNVIGGGDWAAERLVPDIIRSFMARQEVVIRSPKAIRPWQHVCEPLWGYLLLAEKLCAKGQDFVGGWNFGPEQQDARDVAWISNRLVEQWPEHVPGWRTDSAAHPHEAHYLKLDNTKARTYLGWQPTLDLSTALGWTIDWYYRWHQGDDMKIYTEQQINDYIKRVGYDAC